MRGFESPSRNILNHFLYVFFTLYPSGNTDPTELTPETSGPALSHQWWGSTSSAGKHSLTSHTKINSKWIKDLDRRSDSMKLLEENISRTFFDINHSNIFLDPPPRVMKIKGKINKWDWNLKALDSKGNHIPNEKLRFHRGQLTISQSFNKWENNCL